MTSIIQSIQPFSITISSGNTSNTATISAVTFANSVVFFNGLTTTQNTASAQFIDSVATLLTLTNSTTVTASRGASNSDSVTVTGTVVEFKAAALSGNGIQTAGITINTALTSATSILSSVNTGNAVILLNGWKTTQGSGTGGTPPFNVTAGLFFPAVAITNSTTVTATRTAASSGASHGWDNVQITLGYTVIEFASSVIQSIQQRSITTTSGNSSDTDTISSVNTNNALILYNGINPNNANFTYSDFLYSLSLIGSTTVELDRSTHPSSTVLVNYTVLEFASGVLNSAVQRGSVSVAAATSNTATISSVDTSKSLCNWVGFNANGATQDEAQADLVLTNSTTVTAAKNTAGSSTSIVSYEIAEFAFGIGSSVSVTESPDMLSASTTVTTPGELTASLIETPDSLSASSHVIHAMSASVTESADSLTASAHVLITASAALTESPDTTASELAAFFRVTGSRDISYSTHAASSGAAIAPVLFAKLEFDEGDINLHTWLGDISFSGDTYTGVGKFAGIGAADEVSDLSMTNITLSLSGLPNDLISVLFNQQYQGRRATIFLGYLDQTTFLLVDTPTILYRGIIDTADFAQSDTFSISLSVGNRFAAWNNPIVRRYNNADQQNRFPGDKGLQFIEQSTQKTVIWGAAS